VEVKMVMTVNNVLLSPGTGQKEVKATNERTAAGEDFYSFLNKSMGSREPMHANREKQVAESSSGYQRGVKKELNGDRINAIQKGDPEENREIPGSDSSGLKKPENLLYMIDEIMALLQKLNIFFENIEIPDEYSAGISIPEKIRSIVNQSIGMLLEAANYAGEGVGKLAEDMAGKMMQMLTDELLFAGSDVDVTVITDHFKELLSGMLNEAESLKAELTAESIMEDINPEVGNETGITDESDIQLLRREEVQGEDDSRQDHDDSSEMKDGFKGRQKVPADDAVNIHGRQNINAANPREDINHVLQNNAAENTRANEPVYHGPVSSGNIDKAEILHQVAEKVQVMATSERSEMIIQLKPESLGKIQLQVIHERGEIIAKFLAENEHVKSILESNMQYLRDALEKSGVDVQSLSVAVGQHNSDDGGSYRSWNSPSNLTGIYYEELPEAANVSSTYGYTGLSGDLHGYTGSEINLIA